MNELGRLELRSLALLCVVTCSVVGCAEGYEGVGAIRQSAASGLPGGGAGTIAPRAGNGGAGGASGASGASGAGGAAGSGTNPATGTGMPCVRGETAVCTCVDKGTMGQATCVFDSASPLDGFFSDCGRCPDPMTMDPGDVMTAGSGGTSGSGGTGGRSGSGGSSGSAGSGGSTSPPPPTGGGGRSCASPCNQPCFPIGILACCNPLGVCGCTWAPGGYCL